MKTKIKILFIFILIISLLNVNNPIVLAFMGSESAPWSLPEVEGSDEKHFYPENYKKEGFPKGEVGKKGIIFEDEKTKVELISVNYKEKEVSVIYDITNKSEESLFVTPHKFSVNGIEVNNNYIGPQTLIGNSKGRFVFEISYYSLDQIKVKNINTIALKFYFYYPENTVISETFSTETTLDKKEKDILDDSKILYEDKNLKIYLLGKSIENNYILYGENLSDEAISISAPYIVVDDYAITSYFYLELQENSKGVVEIFTGEEELKFLGLKNADEGKSVEINFLIYNINDSITTDFIKIK